MAAPIDLVEQAARYLNEHGFPEALCTRLSLMTGQEAVVLGKVSRQVTESYLDGQTDIEFIYQVICCCRDDLTAMEKCTEVATLLDGATIESANGSYVFFRQEIHTEPQEIRLAEPGFFAREVRIGALITASEQR